MTGSKAPCYACLIVSVKGTGSELRRLCFFLNSYTYGGVEEHVVLLCGLLPKLGYSPIVVCSEHAALRPLYERLDALGVRRHWFEPSSGKAGKLRDIVQLARLFKSEGVKLLHMQLIFTDGGRIPLSAAALAGVPVVITHHAAPRAPQSQLSRLTRRPLLAMADEFIAVSRANRSDQISYMGLPPERLTSIHNGIVVPPQPPDRRAAHAELLAELKLPADTKVLGAAGRLSDQKGFHWLLEAAARIRASIPNARVVLAGDGPLRQQLHEQAARLGISDIVSFLGFRKDTPSLLAAFDLLVMPSVFEGLPLVLLEAFAAGCPVVAHAVDGIPEVIDDGVNGFLVPAGDVSMLAQRMLDLAQNDDLRERMSAAAHQKALSGFTAERMADDTVALYDAVVRRSRGSRLASIVTRATGMTARARS